MSDGRENELEAEDGPPELVDETDNSRTIITHDVFVLDETTSLVYQMIQRVRLYNVSHGINRCN